MIEIINQQGKYWLNLKSIRGLMQRLVAHYKLDDPELTLVFVDNKRIKQLNRKFLKKDRPTDVLSFPLGEKSPDGKYYLGDIVISVPQAFDQCFHEEHGLEREVKLLMIHGFLHLLGYEHEKGIEEEELKIRETIFKGENAN